MALQGVQRKKLIAILDNLAMDANTNTHTQKKLFLQKKKL